MKRTRKLSATQKETNMSIDALLKKGYAYYCRVCLKNYKSLAGLKNIGRCPECGEVVAEISSGRLVEMEVVR